jgi:serine/threonine protein kinase
VNLNPEIERIFHAVADLEPGLRAQYFKLHELSPAVCLQVEALLACDETSSHSLDGLVREQAGAGLHTAEESAAGAECGPYRLLKLLGRGGMGEVWLAERTDGLMKRQVALKLPHAGIQAWELVQRSHRERDILASLTHPGIARLYDAGLAEGGRPFLVLEYIEGVAVDQYCDGRQLPVRARLSLFLQVLLAVQYAHSHLVIHRDLKPANILVTSAGEVKLLDFGISKLMEGEDTPESDLTLMGSRAMTPAYAAPEQIAGQRVTTACDVYALGVILYELLSGQRPNSEKKSGRGAPEISVPTAGYRRPSQVTADVGEARARGSTPKRLAASLKGDLDNIALKAIQDSPNDRYPTVDAFKSDIERYLAGEPVLARPESAWYRARKLVARHRLAVAAVAGVTVALAAGLSVALREAAAAKREAQTSAAVQEFIQGIFETNSRDQTDPLKARQTTARELLDIGAGKIGASLNSAPAAKEKMLAILANLYSGLGLDDEAVALAKKRVAATKVAFGANDPRVAEALTLLGRFMHSSQSVNEREAVLLEAKRILDNAHDQTSPARAALLSALAEHYQSTDRKKGLNFGAQAIAIYRRFPPSDELAGALNYEGVIYSYNGEDEKAEPLLAEALSVAMMTSAGRSSNLPIYAAVLGETNSKLMHYPEAEAHLLLAWKSALAINGEEHLDSVETESRLGMFLGRTSRFHEALAHLRHATTVCLKIKGPADPFVTPAVLIQYGETLDYAGRFEEGLAAVSQAVDNRRKNRPGTRYLGQMLAAQALLLAHTGQKDAARQALLEAAAIGRKVGFVLDSDYFWAQIELALSSDQPEDALPFIEKGYGPLPKDAPLTGELLKNLYFRAELALLENEPATAASLAMRGLDLLASSPVRKYLTVWEARYSLEEGQARLLQHDSARAMPSLQRAVDMAVAMYDPVSPDIAIAKAALASAYLDSGDQRKAAELCAQAEGIRGMHQQLAEVYERPLRILSQRLASRILSSRETP